MLSILGAGYAYPQTIISDSFIAELNPQHVASYLSDTVGIKSRYSVLTPLYLKETGNTQIRNAAASSNETPTDLAMRAVEMALARAGITAEQLGLVIGECSTPYETIPSEAHRVAQRLKQKIKSFDLFGSTCSWALSLQSLLDWKDELLPEYILLVSTNTSTQRINFKTGDEAVYLGDGAAALVLSTRHPGKVVVKEAMYHCDSTQLRLVELDIYGHLHCAEGAMRAFSKADRSMLELGLSRIKSAANQVRWISSTPEPHQLIASAHALNISSENLWYTADKSGYLFGSGSGCALAEHWERLGSAADLLITQAGPGLSTGLIVAEIL